jgi:hypothetical protein
VPQPTAPPHFRISLNRVKLNFEGKAIPVFWTQADVGREREVDMKIIIVYFGPYRSKFTPVLLFRVLFVLSEKV